MISQQTSNNTIQAISRILIVKPCCIGDVIFTTPLLSALRRSYPQAQIDWAVGSSSAGALEDHPAIRRVIDTGSRANPAATLPGLLNLVRTIRAGHYDLLVVPDRSRWLSLAGLLSGVRQRVGLDSGGRGFGYTIRVPINPLEARHEADIYLDLARALGLSTENCWANIGISPPANDFVIQLLAERVPPDRPLVLVHPGGGVNPGMVLTSKRWPPDHFAKLAQKVADFTNGLIIILGSPNDSVVTQTLIASLAQSPQQTVIDLSGALTLPQIAALSALPRVALYIGNDNGIAHLAAAAGAPVVMIFGPSDPRRYAPFVAPGRAVAAWRPVKVPEQGVAGAVGMAFNWERDGISVNDTWEHARKLLEGERYAKK